MKNRAQQNACSACASVATTWRDHTWQPLLRRYGCEQTEHVSQHSLLRTCLIRSSDSSAARGERSIASASQAKSIRCALFPITRY